ncbi:MAG: aminoacyl-tRNA hydrolase [Polyangiaceae bacterium]|nr:aminoacyl-tRNA hydrolase [Polyangiaceae bacterium]
MSDSLDIDATHSIPARELTWTAVRASGPGGQNVNKVSSKVELRFDLAATSAIDAESKGRLAGLAGSRLDADGTLRIVVQDTRDQRRNLEIARERLAELIRAALVRPKKRRPTRPSRGARERRLAEKRHRGETKRVRAHSSSD